MLLVPLLLLQTFNAADLFCSELAHSNLLSIGCPHNLSSSHDSGEAHRGALQHGDESSCNCPCSKNSLPDGLVKLTLNGSGLPALAISYSLWPVETRASSIQTVELRPESIPRRVDRPPRILS